jgi:hypothetical protein
MVNGAVRDGTRMGNIQFGSNTALWYQNNIEIPFFNYYLKGKEPILIYLKQQFSLVEKINGII